jgi:hypothetical protein
MSRHLNVQSDQSDWITYKIPKRRWIYHLIVVYYPIYTSVVAVMIYAIVVAPVLLFVPPRALDIHLDNVVRRQQHHHHGHQRYGKNQVRSYVIVPIGGIIHGKTNIGVVVEEGRKASYGSHQTRRYV